MVVPEADLLGHQRPEVPAQFERAGPGEHAVHGGLVEVAGQRRGRALQAVVRLGVVRDAAPRADVDYRLPPGRAVDEAVAGLLEAAAAALGEQCGQVDEGEPETAQHEVFAGGYRGEVGVGGEGGREVEAAVPRGEPGHRRVPGLGGGVEVADGEGDVVGGQRAVAEPDQLRAVGRAGDLADGVAVHGDGDVRRQVGDRAAEHPVQVGALGPPAGEVGRRERPQLGPYARVGDLPVRRELRLAGGPFGQRRAGADGPLDGRALVGEHGDVLGHRVHQQQRRLVVAPDPARSGRVRVDQMDVQRAFGGQQFGRVGGDPLQ